MNDPLFSKEALSGYIDKREVPVITKQLKTYAITSNENTSRLLNFSAKGIMTWTNVKISGRNQQRTESSFLKRTGFVMGAICEYLLITMQGAVNREEFAQYVKKTPYRFSWLQAPKEKQIGR